MDTVPFILLISIYVVPSASHVLDKRSIAELQPSALPLSFDSLPALLVGDD